MLITVSVPSDYENNLSEIKCFLCCIPFLDHTLGLVMAINPAHPFPLQQSALPLPKIQNSVSAMMWNVQ